MLKSSWFLSVAIVLLLTDCSSVRPVTSAPTPASIQSYLESHPHVGLRLIDQRGRGQWIYDVQVRGDTLYGLRNPSMPRDPIAVPFSQVTGVEAPRFSAARTLGLVGGLAAIAGVMALTGPKPVY
jgi:hypothetical protein